MDTWKYSEIPWNDIKEISQLTFLVYDYAKNWKINEIRDLYEFLNKNKENKELSSEDKDILKNIKKQYPDAEVVNFFTNSADLQCVIGKNPHKKRYTLIFRGSESISDWLYDMMVLKTRLYDNVKVHYGFNKQLTTKNTYDRLVLCIGDLIKEHPDWEWYVGGHSLGGALSTLAGFLLSRTFYDVKWTVVSLASPRVGNKDFKYAFDSQDNLRLYRLCNNKDIIPAFPMFYYCHTGFSLHFNKKDKKWYEYGYLPKFSYYFYNLYNPWDHMCGAYMNAINFILN